MADGGSGWSEHERMAAKKRAEHGKRASRAPTRADRKPARPVKNGLTPRVVEEVLFILRTGGKLPPSVNSKSTHVMLEAMPIGASDHSKALDALPLIPTDEAFEIASVGNELLEIAEHMNHEARLMEYLANNPGAADDLRLEIAHLTLLRTASDRTELRQQLRKLRNKGTLARSHTGERGLMRRCIWATYIEAVGGFMPEGEARCAEVGRLMLQGKQKEWTPLFKALARDLKVPLLGDASGDGLRERVRKQVERFLARMRIDVTEAQSKKTRTP